MRHFCGKHHFSGRIVDQGETGCPAPRINLEPERVHRWLLDHTPHDNGEWIPFEHRCFA
jgi:hypothetical protein